MKFLMTAVTLYRYLITPAFLVAGVA